ncbi:hypothetical protein BGZ83_002946, partial [Gryganskiella cystojenkinii]
MDNPWYTMLLFTASIYVWIERARRKRRYASPPALPRGKQVPLLKTRFGSFGLGYDYVRVKMRGEELPWIYKKVQEQGSTLCTKTYGHSLILAFEPSSVQHMLVKNFENYPK